MKHFIRQCDFSDRRWYVDIETENTRRRIGYISEYRDGFNAQWTDENFLQVIWNEEHEEGLWSSLDAAKHAVLSKYEDLFGPTFGFGEVGL